MLFISLPLFSRPDFIVCVQMPPALAFLRRKYQEEKLGFWVDRGRRLYTGYDYKTLSDFFSHNEISILFTYFIYLFYLFIF